MELPDHDVDVATFVLLTPVAGGCPARPALPELCQAGSGQEFQALASQFLAMASQPCQTPCIPLKMRISIWLVSAVAVIGHASAFAPTAMRLPLQGAPRVSRQTSLKVIVI
jgi:hypothetical protein